MEKKRSSHLFRSYLKMHWKGFLLFAGFCLVEAVVFGLYHLPVAAVGYAVAICAFFGSIIIMIDYGKFCYRHKRLQQVAREAFVTLENLPCPANLAEADYQEIAQTLLAWGRKLSAEKEENYRELVEYYTLWVHQIKTPIAAMRLILQGSEAPESQELAEELQRVEQYVEMVLCYLRLDGDSTDYMIKEYSLDKMLKQVVRRHASVFIRKRIRLNYENTGVYVVTDEKWLTFVLDQIFSNALKYTLSGSITVTVEKPKTLCIRDTGIGIAPEDLPRIFERGYTGNGGRTDKRASGIGLYLCRRICDNLGHRILVTSVPGEGAEVRIDLKNAELEVE